MRCVHPTGVNFILRDTSVDQLRHLAPPNGESMVGESAKDASGDFLDRPHDGMLCHLMCVLNVLTTTITLLKWLLH